MGLKLEASFAAADPVDMVGNLELANVGNAVQLSVNGSLAHRPAPHPIQGDISSTWRDSDAIFMSKKALSSRLKTFKIL